MDIALELTRFQTFYNYLKDSVEASIKIKRDYVEKNEMASLRQNVWHDVIEYAKKDYRFLRMENFLKDSYIACDQELFSAAKKVMGEEFDRLLCEESYRILLFRSVALTNEIQKQIDKIYDCLDREKTKDRQIKRRKTLLYEDGDEEMDKIESERNEHFKKLQDMILEKLEEIYPVQ